MSVLFTNQVVIFLVSLFSLMRAKAFCLSLACKVADGKLSFLLGKWRREKGVIFISPEKRGKGRVVKEGERRGGT